MKNFKQSQQAIIEQCDAIKAHLLEKNESYGDSALKPVSFFSKADTVERLSVRLDDKLNRITQGGEFPGDDTVLDLIGYLVLYRIASGAGGEVEQDATEPAKWPNQYQMMQTLGNYGWLRTTDDEALVQIYRYESQRGWMTHVSIPKENETQEDRHLISDAIRTLASVEDLDELHLANAISDSPESPTSPQPIQDPSDKEPVDERFREKLIAYLNMMGWRSAFSDQNSDIWQAPEDNREVNVLTSQTTEEQLNYTLIQIAGIQDIKVSRLIFCIRAMESHLATPTQNT